VKKTAINLMMLAFMIVCGDSDASNIVERPHTLITDVPGQRFVLSAARILENEDRILSLQCGITLVGALGPRGWLSAEVAYAACRATRPTDPSIMLAVTADQPIGKVSPVGATQTAHRGNEMRPRCMSRHLSRVA